MSVEIIATPGASDANSYATLDQANAYMNTCLYISDWDNATDTNKKRALISATRIIDEQMDWDGKIASDTQSLKVPRTQWYNQDNVKIDDSSIPQFLVNATSEFAKWLLKSDRTAEPDTLGIKRIKADVLEMEVDRLDRPNVIPEYVAQMLSDYGTLSAYDNSVVRGGK